MAEIIVKKDFSVTDIQQARVARAAFKPSKATSIPSRVLNLADLKKAISLCKHGCTKKFDGQKYGYYRQREFPFVVGACDACGANGQCDLYIHESVLDQVWRTRARERRDSEYRAFIG